MEKRFASAAPLTSKKYAATQKAALLSQSGFDHPTNNSSERLLYALAASFSTISRSSWISLSCASTFS